MFSSIESLLQASAPVTSAGVQCAHPEAIYAPHSGAVPVQMNVAPQQATIHPQAAALQQNAFVASPSIPLFYDQIAFTCEFVGKGHLMKLFGVT
uniref:Uncharacterized protein n=1 Tax=Steinernema glaseri TaxID=37863 RepID=A0A1I7ZVT6_9BILA